MMVKTSSTGTAAIIGIIVVISCTTKAAPFVDQRSLDILFRPDNNTIRAFQNFLRGPIFGIFNGGGPLVKVTRLNDLHTAIANNNASASDLPNRPGLLSSLGLGSLLGGFGGGFGGGLGGLFGGASAPATTTARPITTTTTTTVRTTTTTKSSALGVSGSLQLGGRIGTEEGPSGGLNIGAALNVGGILSQLGTSLASRITTTTTEASDTEVSVRGSLSAGTTGDDSNENIAVISLGTSEEDKSAEKSESSISSSVTASSTSTSTSPSPSIDDDDDDDDDATAGVTVSISVAAKPEESATTEAIASRLGVSGEVGLDSSLLNSVFGQAGASLTTAASTSSSGYQYSSPAPTEAKPGYQYEKQGNVTFNIGAGFTANSQSNSNGQVNAEAGGGSSVANLGVNLSGRSSIDDDDDSEAEDADNEVDNKPSDDGDDDDDDESSGSSSDDRDNRNGGRRNARTNSNSLLSLRVNPREINNLRLIRDTSGRRSLVS